MSRPGPLTVEEIRAWADARGLNDATLGEAVEAFYGDSDGTAAVYVGSPPCAHMAPRPGPARTYPFYDPRSGFWGGLIVGAIVFVVVAVFAFWGSF